MSILRKLLVLVFGILGYIYLIIYGPDLNTYPSYVVAIIVIGFYILYFGYSFIYNDHLNKKIKGNRNFSLPDLRLISNILIVASILAITVFASANTLPRMLYQEEYYEIEIETSFEDINFEDLAQDVYDVLEADEIIFYDEFYMILDENQEYPRSQIIIKAISNGKERAYFLRFDETKVTLEHTYGMNDLLLYRYNNGYLLEDLKYFDKVDLDLALPYFTMGVENGMLIYGETSRYGAIQNIGVSQTFQNKVLLIDKDGNVTDQTGYVEYSEDDYYVIELVRTTKTGDREQFRVIMVFEREDS